jgi:hypothetical protein
MNDLTTNFLLPNAALKQDIKQDGNLHYPRKPKLSDTEIIALSLCQECLGIDSENWFPAKLKSNYRTIFLTLYITDYNKRRKRLAAWAEQVNHRLAEVLNER